MLRAFQDHLASVGESYLEHMGQAFSFGSAMVVSGIACLMHGFFPFLFVKTGSNTIRELHTRMVTHRSKQDRASLIANQPAE